MGSDRKDTSLNITTENFGEPDDKKVISELRGESGGGGADATDTDALRRQCDSLRVELEEAQTQIAELTTKLQVSAMHTCIHVLLELYYI